MACSSKKFSNKALTKPKEAVELEVISLTQRRCLRCQGRGTLAKLVANAVDLMPSIALTEGKENDPFRRLRKGIFTCPCGSLDYWR